jgi:hypothetical protein
MRRAITVITITLTSLLAVAPTVAAYPRHKAAFKCPPTNEGLVAVDAQAVIFRATTAVYEGHRRESEGLQGVFGCAYGTRRAYYLGRPSSAGSSGSVSTYPIALAGSIVAFSEGKSFAYGHSFDEIWVRNLRTGQLIHRTPNGSPAEPEDVGIGDTTAIVVKGDGSVAWIVGTREQLGGVQVRSVDKTGSHLLAASPEIDPTSLALAGSTLYWLQAGKPMSATR